MKALGVVVILLFLSVPSSKASVNSDSLNFSTLQNFAPDKKKLKDLNRRKKNPFGVNVYGFGPIGVAAASFDCFITPKVALEIGAGFRNLNLDVAYTIGARYHIFGKTFLSLTPYFGIYSAFHYNGTSLQNNSLYIPVGIHKIKKNKFSWSVEIAYQRSIFRTNNISGGFRVGYRF